MWLPIAVNNVLPRMTVQRKKYADGRIGMAIFLARAGYQLPASQSP
jgi:hypothetical protein